VVLLLFVDIKDLVSCFERVASVWGLNLLIGPG